jgi:hypothetical protein
MWIIQKCLFTIIDWQSIRYNVQRTRLLYSHSLSGTSYDNKSFIVRPHYPMVEESVRLSQAGYKIFQGFTACPANKYTYYALSRRYKCQMPLRLHSQSRISGLKFSEGRIKDHRLRKPRFANCFSFSWLDCYSVRSHCLFLFILGPVLSIGELMPPIHWYLTYMYVNHTKMFIYSNRLTVYLVQCSTHETTI